jgi:hypothetical protein
MKRSKKRIFCILLFVLASQIAPDNCFSCFDRPFADNERERPDKNLVSEIIHYHEDIALDEQSFVLSPTLIIERNSKPAKYNIKDPCSIPFWHPPNVF